MITQKIHQQPSKFLKNPRMIIVDDLELAEAILRHPSLQIPNLYEFLERIESASDESLQMMRCFVNASPFFLENERHMLLRRLSMQFLSHKKLLAWDEFISQQIEALVDDIDETAPFDLVTQLGEPIFNRIARPMLGVFPSDNASFDRIATMLQRLIEPMLSLRKLRAFEQDFQALIAMLLATENNPAPTQMCGIDIPCESLLTQVLRDKPLDKISCYAFATAMYAALAPLVQTSVNMVATIYVENEGQALSTEAFDAQFERLIHTSAAPKYIHRIAQKAVCINGVDIAEGATVLIDIQATENKSADSARMHKHLGFGSGTHFCVGATLSKRILKQLVPYFMQRFPTLTLQQQEVDVENSIAYAYRLFMVQST